MAPYQALTPGLVCSGLTGHAEVVQITFDPSVLPYRELLEIFFVAPKVAKLEREYAGRLR